MSTYHDAQGREVADPDPDDPYTHVGPQVVAYRLVVHGIPDRHACHTLGAVLVAAIEGAGGTWNPGVTMTVESDNVYTATHEANGPWIDPVVVSLRKDTPRKRPSRKGAHV